jgi:hypothetical protein
MRVSPETFNDTAVSTKVMYGLAFKASGASGVNAGESLSTRARLASRSEVRYCDRPRRIDTLMTRK